MTKEVEQYFFKKYEKASFSVVPGHWPDFKSKEEVDEWIDDMQNTVDAIARMREVPK